MVLNLMSQKFKIKYKMIIQNVLKLITQLV